VLLFHGVNNSREQTLSRIALLVPAGFRCLTVDHRAHGQSQGQRSSFGYHERNDVRALLKFAGMHWQAQPLAVLGMSMGAAAVCFAAKDVRTRAKAVVLESLYHDIGTAFRNRLQAGLYPPYFERLAAGVFRECERQLKVKASWLTPADHLAQLAPTPFLLLTGSADRHSTPEEAQRLLARREGPGELFLLSGAGHEDLVEAGGERYRQAVLGFLDRWLFGVTGVAA
jgi:alpha-beta hydrolase superfamily lysophospholipase